MNACDNSNDNETLSVFSLRGDQVLVGPVVHIIDEPFRGLSVRSGEEAFGSDVTFLFTYAGPDAQAIDSNGRFVGIEAYDQNGVKIFGGQVEAPVHGGISVGEGYLKMTIDSGVPGYEGKTVMITSGSFANLPVDLPYVSGVFYPGKANPPCFTADCDVFDGDWRSVRVGDLKAGDTVMTGAGPKVLAGVFSRISASPEQVPVSVLGQRFSPQHRVRVRVTGLDGKSRRIWMKATLLDGALEGCGRDRHREGDRTPFTTYIHLMTDAHDVILGPITDSESLLVTERSLSLFDDAGREAVMAAAAGHEDGLGRLTMPEAKRKDLATFRSIDALSVHAAGRVAA